MTPEQVKEKVKSTYARALLEKHVQWQHSQTLQYEFRDLRLYGREAKVDFVLTHAKRIVEEAVSEAECKRGSLSLPLHGCGKAALDGAAHALREVTALAVTVGPSGVTLTWKET